MQGSLRHVWVSPSYQGHKGQAEAAANLRQEDQFAPL